jgi:hypothetical protein
MMMYVIIPYEPTSRFPPPLAVYIPSYLVPVVHRSDPLANQISLLVNISNGAREAHCLPVKIAGKKRTHCSESRNLLTA